MRERRNGRGYRQRHCFLLPLDSSPILIRCSMLFVYENERDGDIISMTVVRVLIYIV